MKYGRCLAALALAASLLLPAPQVQARDYDDDEIVPIVEGQNEEIKEDKGSRPDSTASDGWFSRQEEEQRAKEKEKEKRGDERFVPIVEDQDGFSYYLDARNARWINLPHSSREKIADVWVKLVATGGEDERDSGYSYPATYFLEHYYIRPQTQQIQFLCELEVTGRPQNAIKERPYSAKNWENLVPGSIEDAIYHAVLERMKQEDKKKMAMTHHGQKMTVRDAVEEYLRISF